jgi:hypothetical protein
MGNNASTAVEETPKDSQPSACPVSKSEISESACPIKNGNVKYKNEKEYNVCISNDIPCSFEKNYFKFRYTVNQSIPRTKCQLFQIKKDQKIKR